MRRSATRRAAHSRRQPASCFSSGRAPNLVLARMTGVVLHFACASARGVGGSCGNSVLFCVACLCAQLCGGARGCAAPRTRARTNIFRKASDEGELGPSLTGLDRNQSAPAFLSTIKAVCVCMGCFWGLGTASLPHRACRHRPPNVPSHRQCCAAAAAAAAVTAAVAAVANGHSPGPAAGLAIPAGPGPNPPPGQESGSTFRRTMSLCRRPPPTRTPPFKVCPSSTGSSWPEAAGLATSRFRAGIAVTGRHHGHAFSVPPTGRRPPAAGFGCLLHPGREWSCMHAEEMHAEGGQTRKDVIDLLPHGF